MINQQQYPKIAVLLTVCNGVKWLLEQINSILMQKNVEVTIYISVDESNDDSEQFCLELSKDENRIIVLPSAGVFGSAAANFFRLIRETNLAQYDFTCFADQDDIWLENKLSVAIDKIKQSHSDAYSSNVNAFWSNGKTKLINKSQPQKAYDYIFESAGPGCTFVLKNNLAIEIQKHLKENSLRAQKIELHDWFVYAFARSNGYKWIIDDQPYMLYRQHANNIVGANVGLKSILNRWSKLREGWFISQAMEIAKLVGYENQWPIKRLTRFNFVDKFILSINASKFRRRCRDILAFKFAIIFTRK